MSSERAGAPTQGALNREKALEAYTAWVHRMASFDELLDALEACVVPDPRDLERERDAIDGWYAADMKLARIEALHVPDPYDHRPNPRCADCDQHWPCSTIHAING